MEAATFSSPICARLSGEPNHFPEAMPAPLPRRRLHPRRYGLTRQENLSLVPIQRSAAIRFQRKSTSPGGDSSQQVLPSRGDSAHFVAPNSRMSPSTAIRRPFASKAAQRFNRRAHRIRVGVVCVIQNGNRPGMLKLKPHFGTVGFCEGFDDGFFRHCALTAPPRSPPTHSLPSASPASGRKPAGFDHSC